MGSEATKEEPLTFEQFETEEDSKSTAEDALVQLALEALTNPEFSGEDCLTTLVSMGQLEAIEEAKASAEVLAAIDDETDGDELEGFYELDHEGNPVLDDDAAE